MAKPGWDLEEESQEEPHGDLPSLDTSSVSSKLEQFRKRHPGTYTKDDLDALGKNIREKAIAHHHVWLVLVCSDTEDWGIVEDTLGDLLWTPGKGDIVGTWSRSSVDGCIHVSLLTAISALEDRSVAVWTKYAAERAAQKAAGKKPRSPRKKKEEEPESIAVESVETKLAFNSLRARLRKAKG